MARRPREVAELEAVHDDDLDQLLDSLKIRIEDGHTVKCGLCGQGVTKANLQAIVPQSGQLRLICDRPDCLVELSELIESR